jgi:hypothetical protein
MTLINFWSVPSPFLNRQEIRRSFLRVWRNIPGLAPGMKRSVLVVHSDIWLISVEIHLALLRRISWYFPRRL